MASLGGWLRCLRFGGRLVALAGALWLSAAAGGARAQALPPRHFAAAEGITDPTSFVLAQEPGGRLWAAGDEGVLVYEGQRFQPWPLTLAVEYLTSGPHGQLWAQLGDRRLGYLDGQRRLHVLRLGSEEKNLIWGELMCAPDGTGLYLAPHTGGLFHVSWRAPGDTLLQRLQLGAGLPQEAPVTLAFDSAGHLGVGTRRGLLLLNAATGQLTAAPSDLPPAVRGAITAVAAARAWPAGSLALAGNEVRTAGLWCATTAGLVRLATAGRAGPHLTHTLPLPVLAGGAPVALLEDRNGQLWVQTSSSLYVVPPGAGAVQLVQPIRSDFSHPARLLEDREGNIWVNSHEALEQYAATPVLTSFGPRDGLPDPYGRNMLADPRRAGRIWLGTSDGPAILDLLVPNGPRLRRMRGSKGFAAKARVAAFGHRGELYIIYPDHIERLDTSSLRREVVAPIKAEAIAVDGAGRIWAFRAGQITVLDPANGKRREFFGIPGAPRGRVLWPIAAPDGRLWLSSVESGELVCAEWPAGVPNPRFRAVAGSPRPGGFSTVALDSAGTLWLGADYLGLMYLDSRRAGSQLTLVRNKQLTHLKNLSTIVPDHHGRLWLYDSEAGVFRYTLATTLLERFPEIPDAACIGLWNGGLVLKDGTFWWGWRLGLFGFNPRYRPRPIDPPLPEITGTQVFLRDTVLKPRPGYKYPLLRHDQNYLTFQYSALSLTQPEKVRYRHRLVRGNETDATPWGAPVAATSATFTNLAPGTYRFEVKAANYTGAWSRRPATFLFIIEPPWWFTGTAYALYALLLGVAAYGAYRRIRRSERERADRRAEQQHLAHLQALDRAKSDFFTNISHELRTPLTLILGPAETLADAAELAPEARRQLGESVRRNGRKLLTLTNQLLDLSKLEAGALRLHLATEPDLTARVQQVVSQFVSLADAQRIALRLDVPATVLPLVCDVARLELVLNNLLANALKFTPAGGTVVVRVRSVPGGPDAPRGAVVLEVADTGRGIAARHHARLFERFYQVTDEAAPEGRPGTGVGLALVRELVALHGGTVELTSVLGRGTTFTVTLPRRLAASSTDPQPVVSGRAAAAITESSDWAEAMLTLDEAGGEDLPEDLPEVLTILIVEDNAEVRAFIETTLAPLGYRLLAAADGQAGLEIARAEVPDLIVTDVMMPRMDGYQLCAALKTDVATSHIPLVLLTAKASADDKIEGLETGADAFLAKPFAPRELVAQVRNLLTLRQQVRAHFGVGSDSVTQQETGNEQPETRSPDPLAAHHAVVAALPSLDQQFLRRVEAAVEAHFEDSAFTVEDLAEAACLSRAQLHRKLKAFTGQAPSDYVRRTRLLRAHALLAARVGTVADVAYRVGFSAPTYFSVCFSRQFGYPPSEVAVRGSAQPSA